MTRSVTVAKANQTIAFAQPSPQTFGDAPFNLERDGVLRPAGELQHHRAVFGGGLDRHHHRRG